MRPKDKAKQFLSKYYNGGEQEDIYTQSNPYQYDPNFQTAYQNQIVQLNQPKTQGAYSQPEQKESFLEKGLPFVSPLINLGIGIKGLFEAGRLRRKQQAYERAFQKQLSKRQEQSRTEDYYYTPYYQEGGEQPYLDLSQEMDSFLDYYNQQEGQTDLVQQQMQDYYNQKNDLLKEQVRQKRQSGFGNLFQGVLQTLPLLQEGGQISDKLKEVDIDIAKAKEIKKMIGKDSTKYKDYQRIIRGLDSEKISKRRKVSFGDRFREHQDGGESNQYDPRTDLYSEEYDANVFLGLQEQGEIIRNEVQLSQIEDQEQSQYENWLFEDEDPYQELNDSYFENQQDQPNQSQSYSNVIDKIAQQESGGDYKAKNPYSSATGKYQFTSHWAGQVKSFMGLPQSFNSEQVMEAFRNNPLAQDQFMTHVVDNIYKPEVERLRPLAQKYGMKDDDLIRMLHYRGIGDTRKRLQTGDFSVSQAEKDKYKNPDILEYLNK